VSSSEAKADPGARGIVLGVVVLAAVVTATLVGHGLWRARVLASFDTADAGAASASELVETRTAAISSRDSRRLQRLYDPVARAEGDVAYAARLVTGWSSPSDDENARFIGCATVLATLTRVRLSDTTAEWSAYCPSVFEQTDGVLMGGEDYLYAIERDGKWYLTSGAGDAPGVRMAGDAKSTLLRGALQAAMRRDPRVLSVGAVNNWIYRTQTSDPDVWTEASLPLYDRVAFPTAASVRDAWNAVKVIDPNDSVPYVFSRLLPSDDPSATVRTVEILDWPGEEYFPIGTMTIVRDADGMWSVTGVAPRPSDP
jgi:hypothetical protein